MRKASLKRSDTSMATNKVKKQKHFVSEKEEILTNSNNDHSLSSESRHYLIEEKAYFIAKGHAFDPSRTLENWLEAESLIDSQLMLNNKRQQ